MASVSLRDFEMMQQLGKGSFGTVHKVRRRATQEIQVMKLISIRQLGYRGQQEAQNEVNILASLSHPYVVRYYNSFVENQTLHIVMEYCEKGDLSQIVTGQRGKQLTEPRIWKYFIQMCLGLEYIHSKKILHRDIKTLNVFLARDESLRIGDLGVAKRLVNTAAFAHTIVGTPYYLSPELCEDKPYNIKSDIWALGCVLYELCTLKHPFEANNQAALFMKIIRAQYAAPSEAYSQELRRIVAACLMRDYRKRPSCDEMLRTPGMRERALGLNIAIPQDSALNAVGVQIPPAPPVVSEPFSAARGLPVIIEEEKAAKRPPIVEERKPKPQPVAITPAYVREFPRPKPAPAPAPFVPLAVVDIKLGAEQAKRQLPKSNEKGVKPVPSPRPVLKPSPAVQAPKPYIQPAVPVPAAGKMSPSPSQGNIASPQKVIKAPVALPRQPIPRVHTIQPNAVGKVVARPSSAVQRRHISRISRRDRRD